jgi:hypothetical protein
MFGAVSVPPVPPPTGTAGPVSASDRGPADGMFGGAAGQDKWLDRLAGGPSGAVPPPQPHVPAAPPPFGGSPPAGPSEFTRVIMAAPMGGAAPMSGHVPPPPAPAPAPTPASAAAAGKGGSSRGLIVGIAAALLAAILFVVLVVALG